MIRLATEADIARLVTMRWDFTIEDDPAKGEASFLEFEEECTTFLKDALTNNRWFIWVAEKEGRIVSHIYTELVHKVPRPGRVTHPFLFMTNVYTSPEVRNEGIGSQLLQSIHQWIKDNQFEFAIVWPSDEAVPFYKRNGYQSCAEPLEFLSGKANE